MRIVCISVARLQFLALGLFCNHITHMHHQGKLFSLHEYADITHIDTTIAAPPAFHTITIHYANDNKYTFIASELDMPVLVLLLKGRQQVNKHFHAASTNSQQQQDNASKTATIFPYRIPPHLQAEYFVDNATMALVHYAHKAQLLDANTLANNINNNTTNDMVQTEQQQQQACLEALEQGDWLLKHARTTKKAHKRYFRVNVEEQTILWGNSRFFTPSTQNTIFMVDVETGDAAVKRGNGVRLTEEQGACSFVIRGKSKELDLYLVAPESNTFHKWITGLQLLFKKRKSITVI